MGEGSVEVEDELIDLNKEPVERERKRKRVEEKKSADAVNEGAESLPKSGRVLRSRTVAMSDGEKRVIGMEIVSVEDKDGRLLEEEHDEDMVPAVKKGEKKKGRRGRPPKAEGKSAVPSLDHETKRRGRGRPPKTEAKSVASALAYRKKENKVMKQRKVVENGNGIGIPIVKRRGRPPKTDNGNIGLVSKTKNVKRDKDHKRSENEGPVKRLKVSMDDSGNVVLSPKKKNLKCKKGMEMGLREQKQLLRDKIVAMITKAGWTVEYRQRMSKDYQDAVYVDRDKRTYWSATLAYKVFKKRIDEGRADERDVSAFSEIPEETLKILYRNAQKGLKAGKKKKKIDAGKTIKKMRKKGSSKSKSNDGRITSKLNRGKQRTLLARRPKEGSDGDGYELYDGKRSLLSWMIDLGTVSLGRKVKCKRGRNKKILREGRIVKEGICCDCCNITHTIPEFESHAKSSLGKPYQNIYLDSGNSLFQCLVDSWKKHVETDKIEFVSVDVEGDDPNDDTCNVCGDGGDLICCDSCPSTFHHGCLHIKVPSGDWNCVYCSCKFCGVACESSSTTDSEQDLLLSELFTCRLCEEKFHLQCINATISEEDPSFCGQECSEIFELLQNLLGVRHKLEEGFFYTVLQHSVVGDTSHDGDSLKVESNSKLAVAFAVMDECFQPIIDERSGTNMIHSVVYSCGSNIRRLNYSGFYTIILEKGDEVVSAASIRIHGSQLAEMPFIGTRFLYRRKGMCSRLLAATEMVLGRLGVEKLVIPAISELNETWTKVFGFVPVEESKRQEMRYMSMIVFPGIHMLEKPVKFSNTQTDSAVILVSEHTEAGAEHLDMQGISPSDVKKRSDSSATESTEAGAERPDMQEKPPSDANTTTDVKKQSDSSATESTEAGTECLDMQEKPPSDANTTTDVKKQSDSSATESTEAGAERLDIQNYPPSDANTTTDVEKQSDSSATESTEAGPERLGIQEYPPSDVKKQSDSSSTESTAVEIRHQNTRDGHSEDVASPAAPDLNTPAAAAENHADNNEDAALESIAAITDNKTCLNNLDTSHDNNLPLKANGGSDCSLDTEQSAEEMDSCPNGFLSDDGKIINGGLSDVLEENLVS